MPARWAAAHPGHRRRWYNNDFPARSLKVCDSLLTCAGHTPSAACLPAQQAPSNSDLPGGTSAAVRQRVVCCSLPQPALDEACPCCSAQPAWREPSLTGAQAGQPLRLRPLHVQLPGVPDLPPATRCVPIRGTGESHTVPRRDVLHQRGLQNGCAAIACTPTWLCTCACCLLHARPASSTAGRVRTQLLHAM